MNLAEERPKVPNCQESAQNMQIMQFGKIISHAILIPKENDAILLKIEVKAKRCF